MTHIDGLMTMFNPNGCSRSTTTVGVYTYDLLTIQLPCVAGQRFLTVSVHGILNSCRLSLDRSIRSSIDEVSSVEHFVLYV